MDSSHETLGRKIREVCECAHDRDMLTCERLLLSKSRAQILLGGRRPIESRRLFAELDPRKRLMFLAEFLVQTRHVAQEIPGHILVRRLPNLLSRRRRRVREPKVDRAKEGFLPELIGYYRRGNLQQRQILSHQHPDEVRHTFVRLTASVPAVPVKETVRLDTFRSPMDCPGLHG